MSDKIISSFSNNSESEKVFFEEINLSSDSGNSSPYQFENNAVKDWVPGKNIFINISLSDIDVSGHPVVNWYCPKTHMRGLISDLSSESRTLSGLIDGSLVRGKIELKLQLLDREGYIITQTDKRVIILEGELSYFPVTIAKVEDLVNSICYLDMSPNADPDELFSISTCRAVINSDSKLFNNKTSNLMDHMPVQGFYLYEVWRQMIESCLNNKSFEEFIYQNNSDEEITLGHVWTSILKKVFENMTLLEIRNLRENNYGQFCCHIQDKILKNIIGI